MGQFWAFLSFLTIGRIRRSAVIQFSDHFVRRSRLETSIIIKHFTTLQDLRKILRVARYHFHFIA